MSMTRFVLITMVCLAMSMDCAASAAPKADLSLCKSMAAQLRENHAFMAGRLGVQPFDVLSGGAKPMIDVAPESPARAAWSDPAALRKQFGASQGTNKAFREFLSGGGDVSLYSWADSSIHALESTSGSADCTAFLFFDAPIGGEAHIRPRPPRWMDGGLTRAPQEPTVTECYVSRGYLARARGRIVFAVVDRDPGGFGSDIRIAPLENGRWTQGCRTVVDVESERTVAAVFRAEHSALTRADLIDAAPAIAAAWEAKPATENFSYGPPLSPDEKRAVMSVVAAIKSGHDLLPGKPPLFGAASREPINDMPSYADVLPIVLKGDAYVLRIGHPVIGWRDLRGAYLVFYDWKGGAPQPLATVIMDDKPGRVTSVRAERLGEP
jgi:hypothetical protein